MLVFLYVRYLRDAMYRYPLYMAKILSILAHTQNIFSPLFYIQNFICYNKGQMIFPLSKPILTTDRKHQRFWQSNTKRQKSKRQKIQMGGEGRTLVSFLQNHAKSEFYHSNLVLISFDPKQTHFS